MASSEVSIQDSMCASGHASKKLSLLVLQSKMKSDLEGYTSELVLIYNQFKSSLELFEQQVALNFTSLSGIATDPTVAKDLRDKALFLAHVTPFYPKKLAQFPKELAQFLKSSARSPPSGLRVHVTQALILLSNCKTKKEAKIALAQHGFKIPSSDQLSTKRIDAAKLEANIWKKLTKDEKLALVRVGREEKGKYRSSTSIKKKKMGGTSNQQKEHKKTMPLAAKRSKIAKIRVDKKKKQQHAGKQFRRRKAWK